MPTGAATLICINPIEAIACFCISSRLSAYDCHLRKLVAIAAAVLRLRRYLLRLGSTEI